jgi:chromosome segregation ATPase
VLSNADQLDRVAQTKELHAEKLMLHDRITKLSAEIVGLNAKLKICENEKMRTAKKLDRALIAAKELEQQRSAAVVTTSSDGTTTTQPANGVTEITNHSSVESTNSNSSAEKELRRQIVVLERQLTESETAKSKVEMTLTERLARPLSQTEAQVADMRRAMEELRLQCKQRVSTLIAEGEVLQDRVKNLEVSLQQVETVSAARFAELMQITEKEIATARAQTEALQTTLCSTQADLAVTNQLKTQLSEYQAMEALCTNEVRKLQNELRMMSDTQVLLRDNLSKSREREVSLEAQLLQCKAANNGSKSENGDTGIDATSTETVVQVPVADHHMSELLQELEDARGNMNDLITEIETVAAEEVKARTQSGRLLRQIAEYQSMQRVALEENLRLQNQIEDVKTKFAETEHK